MGFSNDQIVLSHVLLIKRMVSMNLYDDCIGFVIKSQDTLKNMTNIELRDKIKDNVMGLSTFVDERSHEEIMADLDKAATAIIAVFNEYVMD